MKKVYILILIILIIIISVGTLLLFSSIKKERPEKPETATDETANWEIYQSSRGLSIKCPADFNGYSDLPHDTTAYQDGLKSGCVAKDNSLASIEIVSWTKFTEEIWGKNFTFDGFLKNEREIIKDADPEFKEEEISLDKNPATQITYIEKLGSNEIRKVINTYSQKGKVMYRIHVVIFPQAEIEYLPVINKIISTFKFIGENVRDVINVPWDKETCEARGGKWGYVGLLREERCNLPTLDAGKVCSNQNECEGACLADLSKEEQDRVTKQKEIIETKGECTSWLLTIGSCDAYVEDGKVDSILCVD